MDITQTILKDRKSDASYNYAYAKRNKKSPANAKENVRQWCICEGPLQTKSKLTMMFHLDARVDDA